MTTKTAVNVKIEGIAFLDQASITVGGELISDIVEISRQRVALLSAQTKLTNQIKAICRGRSDGDKTKADALYKSMAKAKIPQAEIEDPVFSTLFECRRPLEIQIAEISKELETMAKELPIWSSWAEGVRGFGAGSLATLIGETGTLSNYNNPAKLWKRMGVGCEERADGTIVRQGGLPKGASAEEWIQHGYSRRRRSKMWVIGDCLMKSTGGHYRERYLERKEFYRQKAMDAGLEITPADKIPAKEKHKHISVMHIHRKAQRKMEKDFLKDLWNAWN